MEGRRWGRGLFLLLVGVFSNTAAFFVFGWATLGWWGPNSSRDTRDIDSLILYTNDPAARITADLVFDLHPVNSLDRRTSNRVTGVLTINMALQNPATFRWAVLGRGAMAFQQSINGAVQTPKALSQHCGSNQGAGSFESAIVGDVTGGYPLGRAEETSHSHADTSTFGGGAMFTLNLDFPNARVRRSGEHYSVILGTIGKPSDPQKTQVGNILLTWYPTCINLDSADATFHAGDLNAANVSWSISVGPAHPQDSLDLADPNPTHAGRAEWTNPTFDALNATYTDLHLQRLHQIAVFIAGIAIGIGTGFIVQGITDLTARGQTSGAAIA